MSIISKLPSGNLYDEIADSVKYINCGEKYTIPKGIHAGGGL